MGDMRNERKYSLFRAVESKKKKTDPDIYTIMFRAADYTEKKVSKMYKRYIIGIDWAKDTEGQSDMTENEAITVLKCIETHGSLPHKAKEMAIKVLEEVQEYRKIGTLEECREAVNKTKPMKVRYKNRHGEGPDWKNEDYFNCSSCGRRLRNKQRDEFCGKCGQKIDWRK